LGAVLINEGVAALLRPGLHGSTFSGGPVACAVGARLFDIISQSAFLARVNAAAARLRSGLETIASEAPHTVAGVRGRGLMQALVLHAPPAGQTDGAQAAALDPKAWLGRAREHGLLVTRAGDCAVRLLPPLSCSDEEIDFALDVLRALAR
jgi:acetylornithine/N-succinyldiaminopimelate aminotransferase